MKKVYFPQHGGVATEQNLVQDLVDEQIKLFGSDVFYIPRVHLKDKSLGEVIQSEFSQSYMIEMFLVNVEGFGAGAEFVSKFGLRITDEIQFVVSRRRWEQSANPALNLAVDGRPNEGDLIYYPLTKALYEIKFVEREAPFYQLGQTYIYQMTAEIYQIGDDKFDTGIPDVDVVEEIYSTSISIQMDTGGTGEYSLSEIITGSTSGVTGEVAYWDRSTDILTIINRTGNFLTGETLTGGTSTTARTITTIDNLTMGDRAAADNREIEDAADDLIDWGEVNPFGEFGNFTTGDF